mmetsp:Transcript_13251/g.27039  ORF Transcript_13251/g.27039 Transcript_13251/m.27039 type:complete len:399 (+) Transcript_13251:40-1236(+)|eukprot:CAMPEP_0118655034 /NCGR_PEP_ID=MMETSP0785-20121206/12707_1 /TAXON_ID=91992 /ORGANISM="Bolidomonas pacifica, Strain CCMP 1866" /LENGTH=398 /DNA_ID=CAMNT_0006547733 /DNA_START=28 /DNA_END=1224 /DNA_ORIENTATION=+
MIAIYKSSTFLILLIITIITASTTANTHGLSSRHNSIRHNLHNNIHNSPYNVGWIRGGTATVQADHSEATISEMEDAGVELCEEQKTSIAGPSFPLCITASTPSGKRSPSAWMTANRDLLFNTLLPKHGAVLLRGFDIPDADEFSKTVVAMGLEEQPYIGGNAVRTVVADRVFTSNESPPTERIPFHHEMAQVPRFPTRVMFYCETPSEEGGETPIVLSTEVADYMSSTMPSLFNRFQTEGVRYIRTMPTHDDPTSALGRGWMSTYTNGVNDKNLAEEEMRRDGVEWEWMENGDLRTISKKLTAIRSIDGKNVFFNQVVAAYSGWNDSRNVGENAIVFGDSMEKLPKEEMEKLIDKMDELSVAFKWRQGDVLIIDNRLAMHSRRPFVKPRRVLASLAR